MANHPPQLSPVADFVEVSKKQRAVLALEKTLIGARKNAAGAGAPAAHLAATLTTYVQPALYAALILCYWRTPIAFFRSEWLAPASWALRAPGHAAGSLGMLQWVTICHAVLAPAVKGGLLAAGVIAPEPEVGLLRKAMAWMGLGEVFR